MRIKQLSINLFRDNRMLIFLCGLLLILVIFPFIHEWFSQYLCLVETCFILLLLSGLYLINNNTKILIIAALISILSITVMWFNFFINSSGLLIIGLMLQIIFFLTTTITLISHVMSFQKVNADTIYGAISAYLLIGIVWAIAYTALELALPESFKFAQGFSHNNVYLASHRFYFIHFLYFSFVTITTLGYGDIIPISLPARGFASIEAITGQLYVAVLIARLVGLHISHSHWERIKQERSLTK